MFVKKYWNLTCREELLCRSYSLKINYDEKIKLFTIPISDERSLNINSEKKSVYLINEKENLLFSYEDLRFSEIRYLYEIRDTKELWTILFNFFGKDRIVLLSLITACDTWYDEDGRAYTEIFSETLEKCKNLADIFQVKLYDRFKEPWGCKKEYIEI